ncbi:MAG: hypothetical protein M1826_004325 [Phylliscum demangeonii]|nr:MAG: hypothetical protein M1826_004325 [Phylliscum demangeonii]
MATDQPSPAASLEKPALTSSPSPTPDPPKPSSVSSLLQARRRSVPPLPPFVFSPGQPASSDKKATHSPTMVVAPVSPNSVQSGPPRSGGHRRGGSEFIGGDGTIGGPGLMSASPTKPESALPLPLPQPLPLPSTSDPSPDRAHRREAAERPSIVRLPTASGLPRGRGSPTSPVERRAEVSAPMTGPRVVFAEKVPFPPGPSSIRSSEASSEHTARGPPSVSGSTASAVSSEEPGNVMYPFVHRPKTAGPVMMRSEREGPWERIVPRLKRAKSEVVFRPDTTHGSVHTKKGRSFLGLARPANIVMRRYGKKKENQPPASSLDADAVTEKPSARPQAWSDLSEPRPMPSRVPPLASDGLTARNPLAMNPPGTTEAPSRARTELIRPRTPEFDIDAAMAAPESSVRASLPTLDRTSYRRRAGMRRGSTMSDVFEEEEEDDLETARRSAGNTQSPAGMHIRDVDTDHAEAGVMDWSADMSGAHGGRRGRVPSTGPTESVRSGIQAAVVTGESVTSGESVGGAHRAAHESWGPAEMVRRYPGGPASASTSTAGNDVSTTDHSARFPHGMAGAASPTGSVRAESEMEPRQGVGQAWQTSAVTPDFAGRTFDRAGHSTQRAHSDADHWLLQLPPSVGRRPDLRVSVDDVPSLTSTHSTVTSAGQMSSNGLVGPTKRRSFANLRRLIRGSKAGEPAKPKEDSRLMSFWRKKQ